MKLDWTILVEYKVYKFFILHNHIYMWFFTSNRIPIRACQLGSGFFVEFSSYGNRCEYFKPHCYAIYF